MREPGTAAAQGYIGNIQKPQTWSEKVAPLVGKPIQAPQKPGSLFSSEHVPLETENLPSDLEQSRAEHWPTSCHRPSWANHYL